MTVGSRSVPYSIVTAVGPRGAGDPALASLLESRPDGPPPIVLNAWAAEDLQAKAGDALDLEYYRWTDEGRLVTDTSAFRVSGVLPMRAPRSISSGRPTIRASPDQRIFPTGTRRFRST